MNLDQSQARAVCFAGGQGRLKIITGGAGSGKTTVIKHMADLFSGAVSLLAPTGKAAARIKEATGYHAETIHRALMYDGDKINRKFNFDRPVIVDESSMVDSWLLAQVAKFNPPRLILVGDDAQLPPVGKGQPFHDLVKHRPDLVANLTVCHRAQGAVHIAAQAIRAGQMPEADIRSGGETWKQVQAGSPSAATEKLLSWIQAGVFDPQQDVVLSCRYGEAGADDGGIDALNRAIVDLLNPRSNNEPFIPGDRAICNKNFADADLWNGDLGTIESINTDGLPAIRLDRDGELRDIEKAQLKEISLAYALSVHKSQGSQFRRVFFMCLKNHWHMLSRPLVYTAITRARQGACVIGDAAAFEHGVKTTIQRKTVLQAIIKREAA